VVRSLEEVPQDVHCDACNIRYDVDFGANVEAVFRCNEAIRPVQPTVYCAASPTFRPHVVAQIRLGPGASRTIAVPLHDADLNFRTLGSQAGAKTQGARVPARIVLGVDDERVKAEAPGEAEGDTTQLELRSEATQEVYLLVERIGWSAPIALGSVVASLPEFVDLFATEAPAAGLELTIKRVTFLFSDLTGSTALYERIGDARAYAVVQEHFAVMDEVVGKHGGAIVKTMGDAVMATFTQPDHAVAAACEAIDRTVDENVRLGIGIKLGVHEGPCLAVRANDRLDFFGTTVNVAARLQGKAATSELVLTRALADQSAIASRLHGRAFRDFETGLKGIGAAQALRAYDLASGPPIGPGGDVRRPT
jgi:class 3 adenylate cyclase